MIVTYGGFSFTDNEAMVTFWGQQVEFDSRGRPRRLRRRMNIEGEIIATTPAGIDTRVAAIQTAFEVGGQDAGLYIPPSTLTHIALSNSNSVSGVRIVQPPSFNMRDGMAHFATGLPFSIALEAEYLLTQSGDSLVNYQETITYTGDGGPRRMVIEVVEGPPVTQTTTEQTPIVIEQSGSATGILDYPDVNPPLVAALLDRPDGIQVSRDVPRMENGIYTEFTARWNYRMTSDSDTFVAAGVPTFPTPITRETS